MRGVMFTAWMCIIGLGGLLNGGMTLWENVSWHYDGQAAVLALADPSKKPRGLVDGGPPRFEVNLKYVTAAGEIAVPNEYVDRDIADRLWKGEQIRVHYSKSHPAYFRFDWVESSSPWGWLLIGSAATAVAFLARKLAVREASASRAHAAQ